MRCNQCQTHGHVQKYCKNNKVCRRCAAVGHDISQCEVEQNQCCHCKGNHEAGSKECERQERKELLMIIQDEEKCHIMRAWQILQNNNEFSEAPRKAFTTHFDCEMEEGNKQKIDSMVTGKVLNKHHW